MKSGVHITKDNAGEFRGRVVARNGNTLIVTSEGYKRRGSAANALRKAALIIASTAFALVLLAGCSTVTDSQQLRIEAGCRSAAYVGVGYCLLPSEHPEWRPEFVKASESLGIVVNAPEIGRAHV